MTIKYRIFSDECMLKFKNLLQRLNWLAILNNDNATESYELFFHILMNTFHFRRKLFLLKMTENRRSLQGY